LEARKAEQKKSLRSCFPITNLGDRSQKKKGVQLSGKTIIDFGGKKKASKKGGCRGNLYQD